MRQHAFKLLAALLLTSLAVALGAAPPNFSGTWKVNISKSNFDPMPAPSSMVTKIQHAEPSLKMSTTFSGEQGERTFDRTLTTDGAESTNQFGSMVIKSKCRWEGGALLIDSTASSDRGEFTVKEKWTLSEDGRTLTLVRIWSGPQGEMTQTMVHERQ
jgi:hypothetical protein